MQQIIFFFIRNKNFLLFGLLFIIAITLTIRTHSYHKNTFISSANFFSGGIYNIKSEVTGYFGLKTENQKLMDENIRLRETIEGLRRKESGPVLDSTILPSPYTYRSARVINNTYSKTRNYITLNKGTADGVAVDLGVITTKGIVGIVSNTSENFSSVQSILNFNSQINAKLKKTEHFGFLKWDGKDPNTAQLIQIPRLAPLVVGDTIVTGGKSTIFPKGILIGTIEDFELGDDDSYIIDVALFNDMTNLKYVYIIENKHSEEILQLETETEDAE